MTWVELDEQTSLFLPPQALQPHTRKIYICQNSQLYLFNFKNVFFQIAGACRPFSSSLMTSSRASARRVGFLGLDTSDRASAFRASALIWDQQSFDMRSTKDGPWCRSPISWHRDMLKAVVTLRDHLSVVLGLSRFVTLTQCVKVCHSITVCHTVSLCFKV